MAIRHDGSFIPPGGTAGAGASPRLTSQRHPLTLQEASLHHGQEYEFGLDLILDGLERARDTAR